MLYPSFSETVSIMREAIWKEVLEREVSNIEDTEDTEGEFDLKHMMHHISHNYCLKANGTRINIIDINAVRDSNVFLFCISQTRRATLVTPLVPKEEQNHVFVYLTISKISEINEATQQLINQNNKIKGLILSSDGIPFKMTFGDPSDENENLTSCSQQIVMGNQGEGVINVKKGGNFKEIQESINRLEKNAVISLIACRAGQVPKDSPFPSLAESVAQIAEGRLVVASNDIVNTRGLHILVEKDTIQFKFEKQMKTELTSLTGKLMRMASSALFITNLYREDATVRFNAETHVAE